VSRAVVENARTLSHALGVSQEAATEFLDRDVLITADATGAALAADLALLLSRSVRQVHFDTTRRPPAVEVVIGAAAPRGSTDRIHVSMSMEEVRIASAAESAPHVDPSTPAIIVLLTACYVAGAVVRRLVGPAFPYPAHDPLVFSPGALVGDDAAALHTQVNLGVVHLAGAGAVGNAFIFALGRFDVTGEVHIADPDEVDEGNLNRTLLFGTSDVGKPKASCLAERAAPLFARVHLKAHRVRLQDLGSEGPWLEQLVCSVDSRRARRALQEELPRDVYDASTSGIADVVLHFNSAGAGGPCLACVYHEDRREAAHEEHVAAMLGVTLEDVRQTHLSEPAAARVVAKHPDLLGRQLVGLACDTLFKELCATGSLGSDSGQQVLAPLAFVSVLAGTMLALEFVRRRFRGFPTAPFTEWHLSPWCSPQIEGRRSRPPREACTFCGRREASAAVARVWKVGDEPEVDGGAAEV
jgi:hypothetical protein